MVHWGLPWLLFSPSDKRTELHGWGFLWIRWNQSRRICSQKQLFTGTFSWILQRRSFCISWGHGISIDTDNDFMKNKKGFEKISGGRMFTAYMSLRGHYASEETWLTSSFVIIMNINLVFLKLLCMVSACRSLLMKPGKERLFSHAASIIMGFTI